MQEENKTAEKAQEVLNQLDSGKKTIDEVRETYGLEPLQGCDEPVVKK